MRLDPRGYFGDRYSAGIVRPAILVNGTATGLWSYLKQIEYL